MADEEAAILAAARGLPLDERVEHKSWKARAEALDEIKSKCGRAPEVVAQAGAPGGAEAAGDDARSLRLG